MEKIVTNTKNNKIDLSLLKFNGLELELTLNDIKDLCGYRKDHRNSNILKRINPKLVKYKFKVNKQGVVTPYEVVGLKGFKEFVNSLKHESKKQNGTIAIDAIENVLKDVEKSLYFEENFNNNKSIKINEEVEHSENLSNAYKIQKIRDLCGEFDTYDKLKYYKLYSEFNKKEKINIYNERYKYIQATGSNISIMNYIKLQPALLDSLYEVAIRLFG